MPVFSRREFTAALAVTATTAATGRTANTTTLDWVKPPALKPGDTIAIVAPARPADPPETVREYARRLEKAGYTITLPARIGKKTGEFGGTDEERADELNAAFRDPKVRAVMAARGGYGLTRILDRLDYAALHRDPKIVCGYSDLTALHLAAARMSRVVTFHSPMPLSRLAREDGDYAFAAASFRRAIFADQYKPGEVGYKIALPDGRPKPTALVGGTVRGRLVGGNLSLICATLGTPYAVEPKGTILVVEDVDEAPYRVDRYLSQLRLAGVLDAVAGVVVGSFTPKDAADGPPTEKVLREYFGRLRVPVVMGFPVGHTPWNATLPHGCPAELNADSGALRLTENPVRLD